jgi:hypothetical protein
MPRCGKCHLDQDFEEFSLKDKIKGLRNTRCKSCVRLVSRNHYYANKESYLLRNKAKLKVAQDFVLAFLYRNPCVSCAEQDIRCLEFDHQQNKDYKIAEMIHAGYSVRALKNEIDKCEVACANCHRRRTTTALEWSRYILPAEPNLGPVWIADFTYIPLNTPTQEELEAAIYSCALCDLRAPCRDCRDRASKRRYYLRNRSRLLASISERNQRSKATNITNLAEYFHTHHCVDCQENDFLCLEFDHLRDKTADVGHLLANGSSSWQKILAEINKCEVICANCHRRRTGATSNSYKHRAWLAHQNTSATISS